MIDVTQNPAGEGRRVLALIAGAVTFYVGLAIVAAVTEWALPWLTTADGSISTLYVFAWFLGTGLASSFGAEAAKMIATNFNRIGLIVLMVAPVALLGVGMLFVAGSFSDQTITAVIFSLIGTAIGLGRTVGDLMKTKGTRG